MFWDGVLGGNVCMNSFEGFTNMVGSVRHKGSAAVCMKPARLFYPAEIYDVLPRISMWTLSTLLPQHAIMANHYLGRVTTSSAGFGSAINSYTICIDRQERVSYDTCAHAVWPT